MAAQDRTPAAPQPLVECDECMKEVPQSAAFTPQGEDYVAHFCGIECYERFRLARKAQEDKQGS